MSMTKKIVIAIVIAVIIVWGFEALVVGHFTDQFASQRDAS